MTVFKSSITKYLAFSCRDYLLFLKESTEVKSPLHTRPPLSPQPAPASLQPVGLNLRAVMRKQIFTLKTLVLIAFIALTLGLEEQSFGFFELENLSNLRTEYFFKPQVNIYPTIV